MALALSACSTVTDPSAEVSTSMTDELTVTSTAFEEGGPIPSRHTCDADDVSPSVAWSGAPPATAAYALIVDDPDANGWIHWLLTDIPATSTGLDEGSSDGIAALNDFGRSGWGGPCPPSGTHRYAFEVLALSEPLGLSGDFDVDALRGAMQDKVLASGRLTGTYRRGS